MRLNLSFYLSLPDEFTSLDVLGQGSLFHFVHYIETVVVSNLTFPGESDFNNRQTLIFLVFHIAELSLLPSGLKDLHWGLCSFFCKGEVYRLDGFGYRIKFVCFCFIDCEVSFGVTTRNIEERSFVGMLLIFSFFGCFIGFTFLEVGQNLICF